MNGILIAIAIILFVISTLIALYFLFIEPKTEGMTQAELSDYYYHIHNIGDER